MYCTKGPEIIKFYFEYILHCRNCYMALLWIYWQVSFFRQVMAIALIQFGRQRGVRSTGVLFIYWLLQLVAAVLALQTHARTVAAGVIITTVRHLWPFDIYLFSVKTFFHLSCVTCGFPQILVVQCFSTFYLDLAKGILPAVVLLLYPNVSTGTHGNRGLIGRDTENCFIKHKSSIQIKHTVISCIVIFVFLEMPNIF